MNINLERFLDAQEETYYEALNEIKRGKKETHWMWFIFPQIKGLGMSETAIYYEINSLEEAKAYFEHEILGKRLLEITNELLKLNISDPEYIFGDIDSLKLKSSMTLFSYISNNEIFDKVLEKYYDGKKDMSTIMICEKLQSQN
ncbi:MAG: DUF1810 domain-containing protein [Bacilli bacterium]